MRKFLFVILAILVFGSVEMTAQKMEKCETVYAYAVSNDIADSTVYISDLMHIENAWINKSNRFLYARNEYSIQFRDYLTTNQIVTNPTTFISFGLNKKKAEKKLAKLLKNLNKTGYLVKYVPVSEFKFRPVEYEEPEVENVTTPVKEKKSKSSKKKK